MPEPLELRLVAKTANELARVHRALRTLTGANRALLRASGEQQLLQDMCRVIVEDGGYRLAWVSYAEHDDAKTLRPAAHVGFDEGFLSIRRTWADTEQRGLGPNPTAIRTGKPCVVRDVQTDPSYAFWRDEAAKRGYSSIASLPLLVDETVIGAISIYAPEADAFDQTEVELLTELANDLSYGIAALRGREREAEAGETIRRLAFHDSLTGLYNRDRFKQEVARAIAAAQRENRPFPLLVIDIDHFREINEGLGYSEGDHLLKEMGARLEKALTGNEVLARLGEDEFAVLIPRGDAEIAKAEARRLREALEAPFELSGFRVDVRVSVGISLFPGHGKDADVLILRADSAMHEAKRAASGYALYSGGPGQDHVRRLGLIADLNHAIDNNQLLLYCQPKVDMRTRLICGAEALVRWRHPEHGMISLAELIPLAERTGQIKPLTYWMVDAALRQSSMWCDEGLELPLAVNVSVRNLREPAFFDRVNGLLQTWGTRQGLLQLELTESAVMEDPDGSLEVLKRLRGLGIELYIDDFGTGYSSLAYLQKLPIDTIKIDQVFVRDITTNEESARIVHSTIDLAHRLDRHVVAEGVEDEPVWSRLTELNCDVAQGYYISKPIPAAEFKAWQAGSPWALEKA